MARTGFLLLSIPSLVALVVLISSSTNSRQSPTTLRTLSSQSSRPCNRTKVLTPHFLFYKRIDTYTNSRVKDYDIDRKKKTFVNQHEKTFERKDLYPTCAFTHPKDEKGPVLVVYICNGRSGSSNTWLTLSTLAGERNEALETVGSNQDQVDEFFDYLGSEEAGSWWVTEHLCETQNYNCGSGIAGFQWKPYGRSITSPAGKGVLKTIGSFTFNDVDGENNDGSSGEKIRVLYMTRNPIDVAISSAKHHLSTVSSHCRASDKECLKNHKTAEKKVNLPTKKLLKTLQKAKDQEEEIENGLREAGIDYYKTTYEKLYDSEDAEEWMRIFRYFGRGPTSGLTLGDVERAFPYAKTSKKARDSILSNFDEVKELLHGTEFEAFLEGQARI